MSEPFLGQIKITAANFAPRSWSYCAGQLLPINQNQALFSILGTTYGGDGETTFALPDLRGRIPVGSQDNSAGPGLPVFPLGAKGGAFEHTLTTAQLPSHFHSVAVGANNGPGNRDTPDGNVPAIDASATDTYHQASNNSMAASTTSNVGGNQAFNIDQPTLGLNYIICIQGTYPSPN